MSSIVDLSWLISVKRVSWKLLEVIISVGETLEREVRSRAEIHRADESRIYCDFLK